MQARANEDWKRLITEVPSYSSDRIPHEYRPGSTYRMNKTTYAISHVWQEPPVLLNFLLFGQADLAHRSEQDRLNAIVASHLKPSMRLSIHRTDPAHRSHLVFFNADGAKVGDPLPLYCAKSAPREMRVNPVGSVE